jgi:hypothetical protein
LILFQALLFFCHFAPPPFPIMSTRIYSIASDLK